jgi:hypothetical protein
MMPRWEVCEIQMIGRAEPARGRTGGHDHYHSWRVVLFTTTGELTVIGETDEWMGSENVSEEGSKYLRALIAHLGADGWEPIAPSGTHTPRPDTDIRYAWYFKRELPDT